MRGKQGKIIGLFLAINLLIGFFINSAEINSVYRENPYPGTHEAQEIIITMWRLSVVRCAPCTGGTDPGVLGAIVAINAVAQ